MMELFKTIKKYPVAKVISSFPLVLLGHKSLKKKWEVGIEQMKKSLQKWMEGEVDCK